MFVFTVSIQHCSYPYSQCNRKRKQTKVIKIESEVKLSLSTAMITDIANVVKSTRAQEGTSQTALSSAPRAAEVPYHFQASVEQAAAGASSTPSLQVTVITTRIGVGATYPTGPNSTHISRDRGLADRVLLCCKQACHLVMAVGSRKRILTPQLDRKGGLL